MPPKKKQRVEPRSLIAQSLTLQQRVRLLVCFALLFYCSAIFVFSLFTHPDVWWSSLISAIGSVIAGVGLVALGLPQVDLPFEEYAYLVTGFVGLNATLLYLVTDPRNDSVGVQVAITLFLLSGVVTGYGAFLGMIEQEVRRR